MTAMPSRQANAPASFRRRGLRFAYEVVAEALLRTPTRKVIEDIASVSELMGFDQPFCKTDDIDLPQLKQRYYDRFFVPTSGAFVVLSECRMADAEISDGRITYGPSANQRLAHIKALYAQAGFRIELVQGDEIATCCIAPDSLAAETAFLAFLENARNEDSADSDTIDRFELAFLKKHGEAWTKAAGEIMLEQSDDLYARLVLFTAKMERMHRRILESEKPNETQSFSE